MLRGLDISRRSRTVRARSPKSPHRPASASAPPIVSLRPWPITQPPRSEPRKGYSPRPEAHRAGLCGLSRGRSSQAGLALPGRNSPAGRTTPSILLRWSNDEVTYLDKIAGKRPVEISSRVGGRKPVFHRRGQRPIPDRRRFLAALLSQGVRRRGRPDAMAEWMAGCAATSDYAEDFGETKAPSAASPHPSAMAASVSSRRSAFHRPASTWTASACRDRSTKFATPHAPSARGAGAPGKD